MPGSASSCALVAELISSKSFAEVAVGAGFAGLLVCATAIPLSRLNAKTATSILVMKFLDIFFLLNSFYSIGDHPSIAFHAKRGTEILRLRRLTTRLRGTNIGVPSGPRTSPAIATCRKKFETMVH